MVRQIWPQSKIMRRGYEARAVHRVTEDRNVADGNDEPWAEEKRPVLEGGERDGEIGPGPAEGVLAR